jgi:DNA-binding NarL/FixJ family response regulator
MARGASGTGEARARRVLVVDDHDLFVDGLRMLLAARVDATCVSASTCERALEILRTDTAFDLVLFDPGLPGLSHGYAFTSLRHAAPDVPIVFLSSDDRRRAVSEALRAGARGYLHKASSTAVMASALELVLAGGTYVPSSAILDEPGADSTILTPRELQVVELVARGLSNKEIATQLGLSESTVRVHVASAGRRLGTRSRFELATSPLSLSLLRARKATKNPG